MESVVLHTWKDNVLTKLGRRPVCGYYPHTKPQIEPTAFAALALCDHGLHKPAEHACAWLAKQQRNDGRVAVGTADDEPAWGTALAILAWKLCGYSQKGPVDRAIDYVLSAQGTTSDNPEKLVDHDATIPGWPWVMGTHSWVEPTAFHVLALQAVGAGDHPRAVDGRRLLLDRLLPDGGCNYGNTLVLGQFIRPHVQPTGLAMLALVTQEDVDGRIQASLDYLERFLVGPLTTTSASYAMIALAAHKRSLDVSRIDKPVLATIRGHAAPTQLALALIASRGRESVLVTKTQESSA